MVTAEMGWPHRSAAPALYSHWFEIDQCLRHLVNHQTCVTRYKIIGQQGFVIHTRRLARCGYIVYCLFVCACVRVCTDTDFSAEDEASGVTFCMAVHPRQEITNFADPSDFGLLGEQSSQKI